jgi:hypothetical protein
MKGMGDRIAAAFALHRALIAKFTFEIVIVFVGVSAAFALESVRRDQEEAAYQSKIVAALVPTLDDVLRHNASFEQEARSKLAAFDAARSRGERLALPIFRETGGERPPVRIWDSVVATGVARSLAPDLLVRLSVFYNRQESVGERYVRYAAYTEEHIFPLGSDPQVFYDRSGKLRPEFAAYVDRLRELVAVDNALAAQARTLRTELTALR